MAKKKATGTAVANIQQEIARQAAAVSGAVGSATGNRIRLTQGKQFQSPDGTKTDGPINVVIVDFNSRNEYYPGAYDPDNIVPPDCYAITEPASLGGKITNMIPSDKAPDKQAEACNDCPMNAFGTDNRGRGKACKNMRTLAVISPDADPVESPLLLLNVSPSSLKRYDNYVRTLATKHHMPVSVITEVSMDPDSDYASLHFKSVAVNNSLAGHYARLGEAQKLIMQEPDYTAAGDAKPAPRKAPARRATKKKAGARRSA